MTKNTKKRTYQSLEDIIILLIMFQTLDELIVVVECSSGTKTCHEEAHLAMAVSIRKGVAGVDIAAHGLVGASNNIGDRELEAVEVDAIASDGQELGVRPGELNIVGVVEVDLGDINVVPNIGIILGFTVCIKGNLLEY